MLTTLAVWPSVAGSRCAPPATTSRVVPRPSTRPPGDFPQPTLRGGCPATARLAARLNLLSRSQSAANTEPLFRFAAQMLDENQAAQAAKNKKPCPSLTRPAPNLVPPPRHAFLSWYRMQQAIPFFVKPSRFYLHGSRSTRSFLAAFHLEPLWFYLFGLLEKILRGLRCFLFCSLCD